MRHINRIKGLILMLRIFGILLIIFNGFTAFFAIAWLVQGEGTVAAAQNLLTDGIRLLIGIGLLVIAAIIKKKADIE